MIRTGTFIVGLSLAAAALAQPVRTEQISYADLNLGRSDAQSTLEARIRAAAGRVCEIGGMQALEDFSISSHCFRSAVKDGYRQMNQLIAANRVGGTMAAAAIVITAK